MKRRISSSVMSPWRILVRGDAGGLGEHAGGELLGGHLEREEADDAALDRALAAVGPGALPVGAGDVEGDVGGERGLAHRRAAGEDQEVRGVQAAEALVEVGEAGGEAGEAAVALVGGVRHLDRVDDGAAEGLEAAVDLALLAELVERLLGLDDLVLRLAVDLDARGLLGDRPGRAGSARGGSRGRRPAGRSRGRRRARSRRRRGGRGRPGRRARRGRRRSSKKALMVTGVASAFLRMRSARPRRCGRAPDRRSAPAARCWRRGRRRRC